MGGRGKLVKLDAERLGAGEATPASSSFESPSFESPSVPPDVIAKMGASAPSSPPEGLLNAGDTQIAPIPARRSKAISARNKAVLRVKGPRVKGAPLSRQNMDSTWKWLDEKIGGRPGFLEAALSSSNSKAGDFVALLLDPAYKTWGTKKLAAKAGLTYIEVVDLFRDRKWLEVTIALHERLPEVIQGAVTDASPSERPCEDCKGAPQEPPCWACGGTGKVRRPGDKDKLAFVGEATGLVGKKGPVVQNNLQINTQNQSISSSFEDLLRKASITLKPKAIEGEVIEHSSS